MVVKSNGYAFGGAKYNFFLHTGVVVEPNRWPT